MRRPKASSCYAETPLSSYNGDSRERNAIMSRMPGSQMSRPVDIFGGDPRRVDTDLLIVAQFEGEAPHADWGAATRVRSIRALISREFTGNSSIVL